MLAKLNGTRPPQQPLAVHSSAAHTKHPAAPSAAPEASAPSAAEVYAVGTGRDVEAGQGQAAGAAPAAAHNCNSNSNNKQGLGAALSNLHIARRFFILAYAWMVMCMVGTPCCMHHAA